LLNTAYQSLLQKTKKNELKWQMIPIKNKLKLTLTYKYKYE